MRLLMLNVLALENGSISPQTRDQMQANLDIERAERPKRAWLEHVNLHLESKGLLAVALSKPLADEYRAKEPQSLLTWLAITKMTADAP